MQRRVAISSIRGFFGAPMMEAGSANSVSIRGVTGTPATSSAFPSSFSSPGATATPRLPQPSSQRTDVLASSSRGFASSATAESAASSSASPSSSSSPPSASLPELAWTAMRTQCEGMTEGARRTIGWWMAGLTAWVFSMVLIGGFTRLTRSGLSMTDWRFVETPPLTEDEWRDEFEKYRQSPEFKRVNSRMTVDDFKFIYFVEWGHRQWGRALGFFFLLPWLAFLSRRLLPPAVNQRVLLAAGLGAFQAAVGWWMVKSGLVEPESEHSTPRVSPYRLAFHLTTAALIYEVLLWNTLQVLRPTPPAASATAAARQALSLLKGRSVPVTLLAGVTAFSGAFVAGNDAGHAFNTWPDMNGGLYPPGERVLELTPAWRNVFEHTPLVQFDHRMLAYSTLGAVTGLWLWGRGLPNLPAGARRVLAASAAMAWAQVALGVTTLLTYVPVSLGTLHQAGALTLLSLLTALLHCTRDAGPQFWPALLKSKGAAVGLGVAGLAAAGTVASGLVERGDHAGGAAAENRQ